jgi:hypothetical protein
LSYSRFGWIQVDALEKHWERAEFGQFQTNIQTKNITAFSLLAPPGEWQYPLPSGYRDWAIDGDKVPLKGTQSDGSLLDHFRKVDGHWERVDSPNWDGPHKSPGLQGPIDDAFMSRFVMVRPTGTPLNEKIGAWAKNEMQHAVTEWRSQFRGDAPVKDDTAITDSDISSSNLILWGDPSSNKIIGRIANMLPIPWDQAGVRFGPRIRGSENNVLLLICPNPLNPKKYVVLNSGFTFREYDYLSNARQVPKLPDWAVIDVNTPLSPRWPGKVVEAGFFDEQWKWYEMR